MRQESLKVHLAKTPNWQFFADIAGRIKNYVLPLVVPVVLIALWESAGKLGYIRPTILPPPSVLAETLVTMMKTGELFKHLAVSLGRVAQGFILGSSLGIIIGAQVALSDTVRKAVSLLFGVLRPIPVMAWIPVLILWMGIDEGSKITVIAIGSFWTVLVNVVEGIRNTDIKYLEVATILEKSKITFLTKVILPSAMPSIITGLRVAIDVSWRSVVGAELIAAATGIGYMIMYARELSQTDVMLVGVFSIGVTGILIDYLLKKLERRLLKWNVNMDK